MFGKYVGLFPQVVDSAIGKIRFWCKTHCREHKHACTVILTGRKVESPNEIGEGKDVLQVIHHLLR